MEPENALGLVVGLDECLMCVGLDCGSVHSMYRLLVAAVQTIPAMRFADPLVHYPLVLDGHFDELAQVFSGLSLLFSHFLALWQQKLPDGMLWRMEEVL